MLQLLGRETENGDGVGQTLLTTDLIEAQSPAAAISEPQLRESSLALAFYYMYFTCIFYCTCILNTKYFEIGKIIMNLVVENSIFM